MEIKKQNTEIVYQNGEVDFPVKYDGETLWLTVAQMCLLFNRSQSVINRHINCAFLEGELEKDINMHFLHKNTSGRGRPVVYYSLDVIISVGYRVKSIAGTRFRQWATKVLREKMLERLFSESRLVKVEERVGHVENELVDLRDGLGYIVHQIFDPEPGPVRRPIGFNVQDTEAK